MTFLIEKLSKNKNLKIVVELFNNGMFMLCRKENCWLIKVFFRVLKAAVIAELKRKSQRSKLAKFSQCVFGIIFHEIDNEVPIKCIEL